VLIIEPKSMQTAPT